MDTSGQIEKTVIELLTIWQPQEENSFDLFQTISYSNKIKRLHYRVNPMTGSVITEYAMKCCYIALY